VTGPRRNLGDPESLLACPHCRGPLLRERQALTCGDCEEVYPDAESGQRDLRLRKPKDCHVEVRLGGDLGEGLAFDFRRPSPPAGRLAPTLAEHIPPAPGPGAWALDLGCGDLLHRGMLLDKGYGYLGMDVSHPRAPILADAHALPIVEDAVDIVLFMNVLEHLQHPLVAVREIARALKPGGMLLGSVAFLEPFHGRSLYHHSHLGTYNTLVAAGLQPLMIGPNVGWTVFKALPRMGRLPRAASLLVRMAGLAWSLADRLQPRADRRLRTCGSVAFRARKPMPGEP